MWHFSKVKLLPVCVLLHSVIQCQRNELAKQITLCVKGPLDVFSSAETRLNIESVVN